MKLSCTHHWWNRVYHLYLTAPENPEIYFKKEMILSVDSPICFSGRYRCPVFVKLF